jgi:hypothetical protein
MVWVVWRGGGLPLLISAGCCCRPWEAPESLLDDAGVELGINYPYPIVSVEDSEAALARAAAVLQQSLVDHSDEVRRPTICCHGRGDHS